jgi:8-oxo-dGTP pyrophosphatase MutT (NUDIX family)
MLEIPDCFYRISVKALVLDSEKRFLLMKQENGRWDLPGGGLDFGEDHHEGLAREIQEEMGLVADHIADYPSYFLTDNFKSGVWFSNIIYLARLSDFNFIPSDECVEIRFFTREEAEQEDTLVNVKKFIAMYDADRH